MTAVRNFGLPNWLTMARMILIPVLVFFFLLPFAWGALISACVFVLAAGTDWLDGALARRLDLGSRFGAFLDPVADKLIVATALVLIVMANPYFWIVIPALVIIGREIAISGLREWMARVGAIQQVSVSWAGKVKTATQMVAIALLLVRHPWGGVPFFAIGVGLLYLAAALTLWSMGLYLRAAWPWFGDERAPTDEVTTRHEE